MSRAMDVVNVLVGARPLIDAPEKWCQDWLGLDAKNMPVEPRDKKAVRFCIWGALQRAADKLDLYDANRAMSAFSKVAAGSDNIHLGVEFNNSNDHDAVLAALDRTIASERAKRGVADLIELAADVPPPSIMAGAELLREHSGSK